MATHRERIELTDTVIDAIVKLSDGNPGAVTVLTEMIKQGESIDMHAATPMMAVLHLDEIGVYGCRIWTLYKDVCSERIDRTLALLRAYQLGFVTDEKLNRAIDNRGAGIDLPDLLTMVKERLPNFQLKE